ncbi:FAD-dependent oxidoreductase [Virgisporangium aliadipatigenens]|uniref:FAD-dependent oxidoreductase n=1 Tax=Virgisporangium aliadipatigenens TaxID=741659 RepID=A0A8J3YGT9_9ACTN|nr:FAD-dependent monooxygenase [Virgisporangium aliadipatigenens]GIJ44999.1 FAD-dependent oxidoreductase [Virgisporangium aliadipatigenens]
MTNKRALVIGGGIAGSVTAIALRRVGFDVVVHEAYDRTADGVGSYLTLAVNGVRALRGLGLDAPVLRAGVPTTRMAIELGSGRHLAEWADPPSSDGIETTTILRSDLYTDLRDEAVRAGVAVRYGHRLVDVSSDGRTVTAVFADGSTDTGDLLIGADGLRSRVRTLIDPAAPAASYIGLLNTAGFAHGVRLPDKRPGTLYLSFGKRCFFGYLPVPDGFGHDGEVWWFANPPRRTEPSRAELANVSPEQWRTRLIELFSVDSGPAVELIEASTGILAGWATYDFPSVPVWHRDRMVIIGDAAHAASPSSGQGASMAVEDAVVLAGCLERHAEVPVAFAAYEAARRERVERVVAAGRRNGSQKVPGPLGRVARDVMLRAFFSAPVQRRRRADDLAWVREYDAASV